MEPTIWDQHSKDMTASLSVATRLQASRLKEGGHLTLTIPGSNKTVNLPIVSVGTYNFQTDPNYGANASIASPSGVGFVLDVSRLHGRDKGNFATIMIDNNDKYTAPPASALVSKFNVGSGIAQQYAAQFANKEVSRINILYSSGSETPPLVHPATAAELQSVGLNAAAAAIKPVGPAAPAVGNNFSAPQPIAP